MNDAEREPWAVRLSAQRRLAIVVPLGIVVYSIWPTVVPIANRLLVTWIAASLTYLVLYWLTILHADANLTRRRARKYDQAAYVIFLLKLLAKIDRLGVRLPSDRRDAARTRAMHLAELLRSRVLSGPREAATLTRSSYALSQ